MKTYDRCGDYRNKSWMKIRMQSKSIAERTSRKDHKYPWYIHRYNEIHDLLIQKIFYEGR